MYVFFSFCKFHENEIDEILDWQIDPFERRLIAFSRYPRFQVRLPIGENHLTILIRDQLNSVQEMNLSSIYISSDSHQIDQFINETLPQILSSEDSQSIGQTIMIIVKELNRMNTQIINKAVSSNSLFCFLFEKSSFERFSFRWNSIHSNIRLRFIQ